MRKRTLPFLLAVFIVFGISACGGKTAENPSPTPAPSPTVAPTPEPTATPEPTPEPSGPAGTNPLTGLPLEPEAEHDRPVAVMFNNLREALPQLGVGKADLIYEVPAEGGITRMLGVFQSLEGVGELGSIRSVRPYYLELALGHDALLVHAGGSDEAYTDISAWKVDNMDGVRGSSDAAIFWRDETRRRSAGLEHSLLTSGEKVLDYLAKGRYSTTHWESYRYPITFTDDLPTGGTSAEHVSLRFSPYKTGTFDYDPEKGQYLIGQYGGTYTDGNTGEQVGVVNVLFLEASITNIPGDTAGRIRVKTVGSGSGTWFCGGRAIPILWSKADRNSPILYTHADGSPLSLGRGTSYICLYDPRNSTVTVE